MPVLLFGVGPVCGQSPEDEQKQAANVPVNGKKLSEWESDLKDRDPSVREQAISMIKIYGSDARKSAPAVIKALKDPDVGLRVNAAITLGHIGMSDNDLADGITALTDLLRDQQGIVRFQAARALGRVGQKAYSAMPRLIALLTDKSSWEIRGAAAFALGNVAYDVRNVPDRAAHGALIGALSDPCSQVRLEVLFSLIVFGIPDLPHEKTRELKALQTLTSARQPDKVNIWARVAIMRIEKVSEQHLVVIAKFLKSPKLESRVHAARAFAAIGPEAKSRIDDLIDALSDKEPLMLFWTCRALLQMGNHAEKAVPALKKLLNHSDEMVRKAAQEAIDTILQKQKTPPKK